MVCLGSLEKMGGGRIGQFGEIGPCWNAAAFRLVCFPLLSNRDWGCVRESVRSWNNLIFGTPDIRVFLVFLLVCELEDLPMCLLSCHESCCQL